MRTAFVFTGLLTLGALACSQSTTSPSSTTPTFTSSDAQVLAKQFANGAFNGANAGSSQSTRGVTTPPVNLASMLVRPESVTCNSSGTSCQLFQQYTQATNCTAGGRISVTGTISGIVSTGTLGFLGKINLSQTTSIIDWRCDGNWVANGDPYVSDLGTITMTGSHTTFSFHQSGGFLATNGAARVSCQNSVNVAWDDLTAGTLSGTMTCVPGGTFSVSGSF
jgi:hypothetical protein